MKKILVFIVLMSMVSFGYSASSSSAGSSSSSVGSSSSVASSAGSSSAGSSSVGSTWKVTGGKGFTSGTVEAFDTTAVSNDIWVVYSDRNQKFHGTLVKWTNGGTNWQVITNGFTSNSIFPVSISFIPKLFLISFADRGFNYSGTVIRYTNAGSVTLLGTNKFNQAGIIKTLSGVLTNSYVIIQDTTKGNKLSLYKSTNASQSIWTTVSNGFSSNSVISMHVALDINVTTNVWIGALESDKTVHVYKYTNAATPFPSFSPTNKCDDFGFKVVNGNVYFVYVDSTSKILNAKTYVVISNVYTNMYNSNFYTNVATNLRTNLTLTNGRVTNVVTNVYTNYLPNDTTNIATNYANRFNTNIVTNVYTNTNTFRYTNNNATNVTKSYTNFGGGIISATNVKAITMTSGTNNNLYLAYYDYKLQKINAWKWTNGGNWFNLTNGFTNVGNVDWIQLKIPMNGNPTILYQDTSVTNKITMIQLR